MLFAKPENINTMNNKPKVKEYDIISEDEVSIPIDDDTKLNVKYNYNNNKIKVYLLDNNSKIVTNFMSKELHETVYIIDKLKKSNKYAKIKIDEDVIAEKLCLLGNNSESIRKDHEDLKSINNIDLEYDKEDFITERLNPIYDEQIAQEIGEEILKMGIINYLTSIYDNLVRGSKKPFIRDCPIIILFL